MTQRHRTLWARTLQPGQWSWMLQAGSALLRVSDVFNDACVKWRTRYGTGSVEWINEPRNKPLRLRGILCEIIEAGDLEVNGPIRKPG